MNVPVIANAGVGDMDSIISLRENGSALVADFEARRLRKAIASVRAISATPVPIRENARKDFSLESGIDKYSQVYAGLHLQARPKES